MTTKKSISRAIPSPDAVQAFQTCLYGPLVALKQSLTPTSIIEHFGYSFGKYARPPVQALSCLDPKIFRHGSPLYSGKRFAFVKKDTFLKPIPYASSFRRRHCLVLHQHEGRKHPECSVTLKFCLERQLSVVDVPCQNARILPMNRSSRCGARCFASGQDCGYCVALFILTMLTLG